MGHTKFEQTLGLVKREKFAPRSCVGFHDVGTVVHVGSRERLVQLGVRFVSIV